jgi:hypothetical protein
MKHFGALVIKFLIVAAILELILLNLTSLTFGEVLVISLVITVLTYLVGDLAVLPRTNNTVATIADIGLALVVLLVANSFYPTRDPAGTIEFVDAVWAVLGLAVGEWVFHKYVSKSVLPERT